jgi:3-hydroxyanthranilate 3,4-dioxygenase
MQRRRRLQTFKAAEDAGPFDEFPVLSVGVDPQLHLSRNDRPQPFFLTCAKNTALVQMTGRARVFMKNSSVNYFDLIPGDFAYIPAGTPTRIVPHDVAIQYRFKAGNAGLEAISWYCDDCGNLLFHRVWDTANKVSQRAYLEGVSAYNAETEARICRRCGRVHDGVTLAGFRWSKIAIELEKEPEGGVAW